jgi:outer membrane receptor protein involved in Fe transport
MIKTLSVALCGGVSLCALASAASAQDAPAAAAPAAAAQGAAPVSTIGEIVVTGSRIVRNGYAAPTPLTVVGVPELQATTPSSIPDALNKLPGFAGSTTNAGTTNAVGGSGGGSPNVFGGNFLNLRDMGAIRTLILMDGRRVPPTAINGQVDTNALPQMLVQRVDVVTGGASAVYGSDAVTGVVNFILDKNFTGLKAQGQVGVSNRGDSRNYRFGIAGGAEVLGRGHIIASFEESKTDGLDDHNQRPWSASTPGYVGAGTAASPYVLVNNIRLANASNGGLATSGPFAGQQFTSTGGLAPFNKGVATGTNNISVGGDGAYYTGLNLTPPVKTDQAFARFEYELATDLTGYVQFSDTESKVWDAHSNNAPVTPTTIYSGNAFLTTAEQAQLAGANAASFSFGRLNRDLARMSVLDQLTDSVNVTAGVTGKVFDKFKWDAYYTHGSSILRSTIVNNINYPNYYAALDAVKDSSGNTVCRVSITNPGLYPGCAPLNLFGANNASAQALAFIFGKTQWQAVNTLDDYAASISGDAFNDWAGPVSVAANVEYRSQSFTETSNANPLIAPSFTGIRMGTPPTTIWAYGTQAPQHGSNSVWEISAETVVPLLKDAPFVKNLEVSGAARYTDYSSSGSVWTWKAGVNYSPIQDLRFRLTESRDIRAPTLADLYSGTTITLISVNDQQHSGMTGVVTSVGGGNPNLVPEVSYTTTIGAVYSPSWWPRFRASIDYYNINISNAIGSINGASATVLAQCEASGGTSPLCASIVRPLPFSNRTTANFPTTVYNLSQNIAELYTHGVDVEASYNFRLEEVVKQAPGRFELRLLYSYQPVLNSVSFPGSPLTQLAGVAGASSSRLSSTVNYSVGPVSLDWQMRYSSAQRRSGTPVQVYADPDLPGIFYHDLNVAYRLRTGKVAGQLFFTVNNLTDQQPRISPSAMFTATPGFGNPTSLGDDMIGRRFTLGFRVQY